MSEPNKLAELINDISQAIDQANISENEKFIANAVVFTALEQNGYINPLGNHTYVHYDDVFNAMLNPEENKPQHLTDDFTYENLHRTIHDIEEHRSVEDILVQYPFMVESFTSPHDKSFH